MKYITSLALSVILAAFTCQASSSAQAPSGEGGAPALDFAGPGALQDEVPPEPDCEELCAALAAAQADVDAAQAAFDAAKEALDAASEARAAALATLNQAKAKLAELQTAADSICATGTPEECQEALDAVNAQRGVVADARSDYAAAAAAEDAAAALVDAENAKLNDAKDARDDAQAAVEAAGCECD